MSLRASCSAEVLARFHVFRTRKPGRKCAGTTSERAEELAENLLISITTKPRVFSHGHKLERTTR
jgi:hypothetical protein